MYDENLFLKKNTTIQGLLLLLLQIEQTQIEFYGNI